MRMSIAEKKILFAHGCSNHCNTVTRLKFLASITVDPGTKDIVLNLARKLDSKGVQDWYRCFFYNLRMEMESYYNARAMMKIIEVSTMEGYADEADEV